jgi:mono/diheme cytochrome c family protein
MSKAKTILLACMAITAAECLSLRPAISSPDDPVADEVKANGDHERGEKLYSRYCRGCHGEEGKGDGLVFMPHVDNLTRKGYIDKLPDSYLLLAITKGGPGIGKSNYMPSWEGTLSKQQMLDIIAYVRSLPLN